MAKYPDWAPRKKTSATVWEREEEPAAPEAKEEPKQPEKPERECPTCHVPLRLWESDGFLVVYQAMSKAMPALAGVPHYHEADLYVCPCCGRYEFFRPAEKAPKDERYEAFSRCSDKQLQAIVNDGLRSDEMRQAAQEVLDRRKN